MLSPVRTLDPAHRLISLIDAKRHLIIDHDDDDELIRTYILAAESYLDGYSGILGRALVTQTWAVSISAFERRIDLPIAPVQTIASVAYFDDLNAGQVVSPDAYSLHADASAPYITLNSGEAWPSTFIRDDAVTISFVAGYGDKQKVPGPIRAACMMLVATLYDQRELHSVSSLSAAPFGVNALCAPFRRISI